MERPPDELTASGRSSSKTSSKAKPRATGEYDTSADRDVEQIKSDISQTQDQLQQTLSEIQERLSPAQIAERAKISVREATVDRARQVANQAADTASDVAQQTREMVATIGHHIRENSIPLALLGIGLGWFVVRNRSGRADGYGEWDADLWDADTRLDAESYGVGSYGSGAYGAGSYETGLPEGQAEWGDVARTDPYGTEQTGWDEAARQASAAADAVRTTAAAGAEQIQYAASEAQHRLARAVQDHPLALGLAALAAGAIVGGLLPRTDVEDSYLGDARDATVGSVRGMAEDVTRRVAGDGGATVYPPAGGSSAML
jgi:ElaB/YqjD/DUF883 family membrane-anchored ribosome-binding protein